MKNFCRFIWFIFFAVFFGTKIHAQQFILQGSATQTGTNTYRITEDIEDQSGMITNYYPLDLTKDFVLNFKLNFGNRDAYGADGFAFILTNSCNPTLQTGGGLGVNEIKNSLIAKFDTYYNDTEYNDKSPYDHTGIFKNGKLDSDISTTSGGGSRCLLACNHSSGNVETGMWYDVTIEWKYISSTSQKLSVYFNGKLRVSSTRNHISDTDIFNGQTNVFWSISGSTGALTNKQEFQFLDPNNTFSVCKDSPITLIAPTLGKDYNWTSSAGVTNTSITNTATYTPTTNQTISCNYTDFCGVSRTVNFVINVSPFGLNILNNPWVCKGDSAVFTIHQQAESNITYNINGGANETRTVAPNGLLVVSVSDVTTATTLTITKIESGGCSEVPTTNNSSTITVNDPPTTSGVTY